MKNTLKLIAAVMIAAVVVVACGKYEEGPKLSLRTKKARLAGDWTLVEYFQNGASMSLTGYTVTTKIEKDGTYSYTHSIAGTFTGTWEFNDDKTELITSLTVLGQPVKDTAKIVKLKNKELWLKTVSGVPEEWHFEQK